MTGNGQDKRLVKEKQKETESPKLNELAKKKEQSGIGDGKKEAEGSDDQNEWRLWPSNGYSPGKSAGAYQETEEEILMDHEMGPEEELFIDDEGPDEERIMPDGEEGKEEFFEAER